MFYKNLIMSQEVILDAIQCFGKAVVQEVIDMVNVSDADCMYTTFEDMGMFDHAECVEMLYFN
jgi:hypothetical protein